MAYTLRTANAGFIATHPRPINVVAEAARRVGVPEDHIFLLEAELDGYTTIQDLIRIGEGYGDRGQVPHFQIPPGKKNKDVCALLSFSSGTTGLPKAAMTAHQNLVAQCLQIMSITPEEDQRKVLIVLLLFHLTDIAHMMPVPIAMNAEVIMLPTFMMESMLTAIVGYKTRELLQGLIDRDGFITITDRIKGEIKAEGIGTAPAELEGCILGHGKVEDCAVLLISDDRAGERPKACVVLKPGVVMGQSLG